ncbi:Ckap2 [Gryllus bimaculatus]|nr:Ckap2 [Gryllus bimaculatus]
MSFNASKRNIIGRPPSSRMDISSHVRSTSNKTGIDRCVGSKDSAASKLENVPQKKTSGMSAPSRMTKHVRNPIPIRHTLTSKLRMEKANPLLTSCGSGIGEPAITGTPSRRSTFHPGMLQPKQKPEFRSKVPASEIRPTLKNRAVDNERKTVSIFKENKPPRAGIFNKGNGENTKSGNVIPKQSRISTVHKTLPSSLPKKNISSSTQYRSSAGASNKNVRRSTWIKPLAARNDASTALVANNSVKLKRLTETKRQAMDKKKHEKNSIVSHDLNSQSKKINTPAQKQLKSILRKSASVGDLRKMNMKSEDVGVLGEIENGPESKALNKSFKSVAFFSPLHNSSFTPINITNTPTPSVLRKRLEDWLAKRGKSAFSYRHLCCFGLPKNMSIVPSEMNSSRDPRFSKFKTGANDQNDAEPCLNETITLEPSDSQLSHSHDKNHDIYIENSAPKDSSTPEHESDCFDENKENNAYLSHPDALNDLRKLVHSTRPTVKEIPQYWECLAALEEARGDFSSAVDCYGRAIVKGADADDVDEHLDDLWEKSINSSEGSFQNVNYIVTPVRRSSRKSTSRFRTTPTVKCVDKLEDIEQNIRETMEFHGNAVLNPGN